MQDKIEISLCILCIISYCVIVFPDKMLILIEILVVSQYLLHAQLVITFLSKYYFNDFMIIIH